MVLYKLQLKLKEYFERVLKIACSSLISFKESTTRTLSYIFVEEPENVLAKPVSIPPFIYNENPGLLNSSTSSTFLSPTEAEDGKLSFNPGPIPSLTPDDFFKLYPGRIPALILPLELLQTSEMTEAIMVNVSPMENVTGIISNGDTVQARKPFGNSTIALGILTR